MGFGGNLLPFRGEIFWKTRETRKFSRSRGFHDNFAFFLRWWSSNEAPLGHWPRHFLRQGKLRRENRAAVTIMEENIDLIFSLRRAAFLLLYPVLHGPRWEHLFTQSGISGDEKSRTHKKHTRKTEISQKRQKFHSLPCYAQANIFPVATFQHRLQKEKKHPSVSVRSGEPFSFRGHCSE